MLNYFLLRLVGPKMGELKVMICYLNYPRIQRFLYDLEIKKGEQNRNNKRTEIKRIDWFIERIQKNFMPENFLQIIRYFALRSYCNTIGQSNKAFSIHIKGFLWWENEERMF